MLWTMIDIHCHILPGVDDGPVTLDESLRVARFLVQDGVDCVVATPHCHRYIHWLRSGIVPRVAELNHVLASEKIPLTVLPGSEIQVTDTEAYKREFEAGVLCHLGGGRKFTLLEVNWTRALFPPDAADLVRWITAQGMTVILAHPERYDYFEKEPALLDALYEAGAWLQITVDSLLGNHGPLSKTMGEALLKRYPLAILASDTHNMNRCSGLSAGYRWVRENLGSARESDLRGRAEQVQAELLTTI
jgi:protein-tyrosine phosphatase